MRKLRKHLHERQHMATKRYADLTEIQKLWILSVAYDDLNRAMQVAGSATTIPGEGVDAIYGGLHDAAVVRYMRPFAGCNLPDEDAKVNLPPLVAFGTEQVPEIHRHARELRNQVVAHSDMTRREVEAIR